MSDLAPAELDHGLHAIAFTKKADGVVLLELVVVVIGVGPELKLLHLNDVLFFFGFVLLLFILVLPLAVIHRLGDGRLRGGSNQNQVEPHFLRFANSGQRRHNLDRSIGKHRAYFANANRFVYVFPNFGATGGIVSRRDH